MTGIPDRHAIALVQHRDDPQVEFLVQGRVGAAGMQEHQISLPKHFHGVVDLFQGAHAGGEQDRAPFGARVAQQVVIGQGGRSDLVAGHVELVDEINRPSSQQEANQAILFSLAVAIDLADIASRPNSRPYLRSPLVVPKGLSRGRASSSAE